MARAHHSHRFQPEILRHHLARFHSKNPNRHPEHITELGSIQIFEPYILPLHLAQVRQKISKETPSHAPSSFSFHFPTTDPPRLPSRIPLGNFEPETPLHRPGRIQLRNFPGNLYIPSRAHTPASPKQIANMVTQPHSCFKVYTITPPSTHPSYHPYQYLTITPSTHPAHTPSHTWDILGRLGRPNGSCCTRIQGWIPLLGPVPDAVVYSVVRRG